MYLGYMPILCHFIQGAGGAVDLGNCGGPGINSATDIQGHQMVSARKKNKAEKEDGEDLQFRYDGQEGITEMGALE